MVAHIGDAVVDRFGGCVEDLLGKGRDCGHELLSIRRRAARGGPRGCPSRARSRPGPAARSRWRRRAGARRRCPERRDLEEARSSSACSLKRRGDARTKRAGGGEHAFERAVLGEQRGRRLGADPARAGQAVGGIAAQRDQVGYLGRIDAARSRTPAASIVPGAESLRSSTISCARRRPGRGRGHPSRSACRRRLSPRRASSDHIRSSASSLAVGVDGPAERFEQLRRALPLGAQLRPASDRDGRGRAGRARCGSGFLRAHAADDRAR